MLPIYHSMAISRDLTASEPAGTGPRPCAQRRFGERRAAKRQAGMTGLGSEGQAGFACSQLLLLVFLFFIGISVPLFDLFNPLQFVRARCPVELFGCRVELGLMTEGKVLHGAIGKSIIVRNMARDNYNLSRTIEFSHLHSWNRDEKSKSARWEERSKRYVF